MPTADRRAFLRWSTAAAAAGWSGSLWTPARARSLRTSAARVVAPAGTTLEATVVPYGTGYRRLREGPGFPIVVRDDLAPPHAGRDDRRQPLASIAHLTDVHLVDAQSPGRVGALDRFGPPLEAAFRPQEMLSNQVGAAMVERLRALGAGPVTGRAFDCLVSTGDNIDNQQHNELAWFITLLDGGRLVPDSGALGTYEGLQRGSTDPHYWHPDEGVADDFTALGFPDYPGLLDAALRPFDVQSAGVPWYSCYGNHDGLIQGNMPAFVADGGVPLFDAILTGSVFVDNTAALTSPADLAAIGADPAKLLDFVLASGTPVRIVTPDAGRRAVRVREWIEAHLASPASPGPVGHGYSESALESGQLYYTFTVAPNVLGICLDTVNHGGYAEGSLGAAQLAWLEAQLIGAHSRYYDASGAPVRTPNADRLVLLFSHHNVGTLSNSIPDLDNPAEPRLLAGTILSLLHRFPNVVGWINGHSHENRVRAFSDPAGRTRGFWEINTAAHIDYPEHARIVELVDNLDGTLSFFATLIEHAGPAAADPDDFSVLGLASISRELSANDPQSNPTSKLGTPIDLNVELVIAAPFRVTPFPSAVPISPGAVRPGTIPATGHDQTLALVAGGAALAGAVALRRRVQSSD